MTSRYDEIHTTLTTLVKNFKDAHLLGVDGTGSTVVFHFCDYDGNRLADVTLERSMMVDYWMQKGLARTMKQYLTQVEGLMAKEELIGDC